MLAPAGKGFAGKMALFSLLVLCLLGTATESRSIDRGRPPLLLRVQRLRGGSEDMGESGHGDMDDLDGGGGDQEDAAWRRVPREEQATASASEDMVPIGRHIAIAEELVSMGSSRERAMLASRKTGGASAEVALSWLLSNLDRPDLDQEAQESARFGVGEARGAMQGGVGLEQAQELFARAEEAHGFAGRGLDDDDDDDDDDDRRGGGGGWGGGDKDSLIPSWKVEEAPTGRSTCRGCDSLISRGDLRIARMMTNQWGWMTTRFYHIGHISFPPRIRSAPWRMVGFSGLRAQQRRSVEALTSPSTATQRVGFGSLFRESGGSGFKPASDELLRRMMEEAQGGGNRRKRRRTGGAMNGCRVCGGVGVGRSCEWCPKGDEGRRTKKSGVGKTMLGVIGFDIAVQGWVDGPDVFWPVKSPSGGWALEGRGGNFRGYLDRSDPLSRFVGVALAMRAGVLGVWDSQRKSNTLVFFSSPDNRRKLLDAIREQLPHSRQIFTPSPLLQWESPPSTHERASSSSVVGIMSGVAAKSQQQLEEIFDQLSPVTEGDSGSEDVHGMACDSLRTTLLRHQVLSLRWMLRREGGGKGMAGNETRDLPPFWERGVGGCYFNTLANITVFRQPDGVRGGILADDMGLGKTLTAIVLIAENPRVDCAGGGEAGEGEEGKGDGVEAGEGGVNERGHADGISKGGDAAGESEGDGEGEGERVESFIEGKETSRRGIEDEIEEATGRGKVDDANSTVEACSYFGDTLVVCPASVISSWKSQFESHVVPGRLSVTTYDGPKNLRPSPEQLCRYNVVLCSYDTLRRDAESDGRITVDGDKTLRRDAESDDSPADAVMGNASSRRGSAGMGREGGDSGVSGGVDEIKAKTQSARGLASVQWWRVVLDEAHLIRNQRSLSFKNRAEDLHALFTFLRFSPLGDPAIWRSSIARPLNMGDPIGITRLRVALREVCMRRTKAVLGDSLPGKNASIVTVRMQGQSKEAYSLLFQSARAVFRALDLHGDAALMRQYSSVLECLLRLRQACCSPDLISRERIERARKILEMIEPGSDNATSVKLTEEEAKELMSKLTCAENEELECAVCLDQVQSGNSRVLRGCKHCFCDACLKTLVGESQSRGGGRASCPLCRSSFESRDVLAVQDVEKGFGGGVADDDDNDNDDARQLVGDQIPPKVMALIEDLKRARSANPEEKSVVFSHFVPFLFLIQRSLDENGFKSERIDGSMQMKERDAVLERFAESGGPSVLVVSTKAGGVGLTLTRASRVYMMDIWWNAAVDEQAIDRVHRIGQKREVTVVKYVCQETVEERLLEVQDQKQVLSAAALRKVSPDEMRRVRATQLRRLFDSMGPTAEGRG